MEVSSLVVDFDELRRCQDVLTDGTAEIGIVSSIVCFSIYFPCASLIFLMFIYLSVTDHFDILCQT